MTGLIYVILIAVWAAVLVPRWLRHHDEDRRSSRPEDLARILSRHPGNSGSDDEVFDQHSDADDRSWAGKPWSRGIHVGRHRSSGRRPVSARGRSARRRSRILIGLATIVLLALIGVGVGVLPKAVLVASLVPAAAYLGAIVIHGRRRSGSRGREAAAAAPGSSGRGVQTAPGATAGGVVVDGVRLVDAGNQEWEPQETTLPTYVTKPKASKVPRRIDLTSGWTGADMVARARAQQASPELSGQFDREWGTVEPDQDEQIAGYANGEDDGYRYRAVNE